MIETEQFFTEARVRSILLDWATTVALAENRSTARGLLRDGATPTDPRTQRQRGQAGDQRGGAAIVADVEQSSSRALERFSLPWSVSVALRDGLTINEFADLHDVHPSLVLNAFDRACSAISDYLGERHGPTFSTST